MERESGAEHYLEVQIRSLPGQNIERSVWKGKDLLGKRGTRIRPVRWTRSRRVRTASIATGTCGGGGNRKGGKGPQTD
jgi:hypothetical protein